MAGMRGPDRRRRSARPLVLAALAVGVAAQAFWRLGEAFSLQAGRTRKQQRGTMHNKDRLATLYELPNEVEEPEPEPQEPMPEYRAPYTMHMLTQFPSGLNPNMKYVEKKFQSALHSTQDLIRHVEVRMQAHEHFHREKVGRSRKRGAVDLDDEEFAEAPPSVRAGDHSGGEALAPFQIKVKVDLMNHKTVVLSNPEKHAQPTLTEAVDHTADLIRKLMREEKDKNIRLWRKRHQQEKEGLLDDLLPSLEDAELEAEAAELAEDAEMDKVYRAIEDAQEEGESAPEGAQAMASTDEADEVEEPDVEPAEDPVEDAVEAEAPTKAKQPPKPSKPSMSMKDLLLG